MCQNSPIPSPPVIESASATTSPDNANSGPFAYVLTAVVVGVMLVVVTSLSSCASAIGQVAVNEVLDGGGRHEGYDDYLEDYVPYDLDHMFDDDVVDTFLS